MPTLFSSFRPAPFSQSFFDPPIFLNLTTLRFLVALLSDESQGSYAIGRCFCSESEIHYFSSIVFYRGEDPVRRTDDRDAVVARPWRWCWWFGLDNDRGKDLSRGRERDKIRSSVVSPSRGSELVRIPSQKMPLFEPPPQLVYNVSVVHFDEMKQNGRFSELATAAGGADFGAQKTALRDIR